MDKRKELLGLRARLHEMMVKACKALGDMRHFAEEGIKELDELQITAEGEIVFWGWYKGDEMYVVVPNVFFDESCNPIEWAKQEREERIERKRAYEERQAKLRAERLAKDAEKDRAVIERLKAKHGWSE